MASVICAITGVQGWRALGYSHSNKTDDAKNSGAVRTAM